MNWVKWGKKGRKCRPISPFYQHGYISQKINA